MIPKTLFAAWLALAPFVVIGTGFAFLPGRPHVAMLKSCEWLAPVRNQDYVFSEWQQSYFWTARKDGKCYAADSPEAMKTVRRVYAVWGSGI